MKNNLSFFDNLIHHFDRGLRACCGVIESTGRKNPAKNCDSAILSESDSAKAIQLLRVNHAGEVAAQALYHGQALMARTKELHAQLEQAAVEENDHLTWCHERIQQLGGHTSYLNPIWYLGSLSIGILAALAGDRYSLGFLVETEHQVVEHLQGHLAQWPAEDLASKAILTAMCDDEAKHATTAQHAGSAELPFAIKIAMRATAKVMTSTAYWI